MLLYHGTLRVNFDSIMLDKELKTTSTQYLTKGYPKTTLGYVYLTKNVNEALGFAALASLNINGKIWLYLN